MRSISPKQQAIVIAIGTALINLLAAFTIFIFDISNKYIFMLFIGMVIFFIVFLLVFYSLNRFIITKLKPIYKTIHSVNLSDDRLLREIEFQEKDIIKDVQADVLIWAKRKTREISQLKQLEKYRREFLGNVSHELKTPIFNIQGYVSTLLEGGLEDETINRRYLERTDKSVNRLISIVNDLESISGLESGELKLNFSKFNIVKLFEDSMEEHERLANKRDITLKFKQKPDKAILVRADKKRVFEVINNLIVNSIKYGKQGGETSIDFLDMDDLILIEVEDNGIGIGEKDLPRLFERFFRTDKSRSREMGGTGLGLSIVKHIIEAHNQNINVRSQVNQGSAFSFTLPKAM